MQKSKCRAGFTLIELLVVIAIIALLAAILFPVFSRARESARGSACLSNMKQVGLGLTQYTQDFDEGMPPYVEGDYAASFLSGAAAEAALQRMPGNAETPTSPAEIYAVQSEHSVASGQSDPPAHYKTWMDAIFPYVKNLALFECPSHRRQFIDVATLNPPEPHPLVDNGLYKSPSYGYNALMQYQFFTAAYSGSGHARYRPVKLTAIQGVASKIFSVHTPGNRYNNMLPSQILGWAPDSYPTTAARRDVVRNLWPHNDASPILFADGHVKSQTRRQMFRWVCNRPLAYTNYLGTPLASSSAVNREACGYWNPAIAPPAM